MKPKVGDMICGFADNEDDDDYWIIKTIQSEAVRARNESTRRYRWFAYGDIGFVDGDTEVDVYCYQPTAEA